MKILKIFKGLIIPFLLISTLASAEVETTVPVKPLSEGAQTSAAEPSELPTDIVIRLANESNENDGSIGPLTYGLRGNHTFKTGLGIEAGYIRLHEPGTSQSTSVLDEAQFTLKFPETEVLNQSVAIEITSWKNRMIDMYTHIAGVQFTRKGDLSINGGLYGGTASIDQASISDAFTGVQLEFSGALGGFQVALGNLTGWIQGGGTYRKNSLEVARDLSIIPNVPLTLTFAIEERFYNFGGGRPQSDRSDRYIYVTGIEVHLGELLFSK